MNTIFGEQPQIRMAAIRKSEVSGQGTLLVDFTGFSVVCRLEGEARRKTQKVQFTLTIPRS